ncbi:pyridoxal phosphate-dependent aminotransferase [Vibrio natriegens]|uniref:MalY/PatB family protein n=1 Tax=Vibrio natriegens TaxID=691 RepID=UPI001EFC3D4C|nr:MalY/PatB family protein [Vibrio natriegens]MCG9701385.1 pyridoxal phosphate-dependent aminotransferase [Vibrio natriegens]
MSSFNFDQIVERQGTGSVKWDSMGNSSILPMWVADMDFRTAEPIVSALKQRVEHGVFGYTKVPDAYYAAVINWFGKRHNFHIQREWIQYTSGVVPALSAILKALTNPGDGVIVQTPAYNCFFSSIRNMECHLVENPLVNRDGYYEMDFDDLERKASRSDVKVLILCNPHNPVGRAWTQEELTRLGEICFRHGVKVISDEIHCDLTFPGVQHQPFAALGDEFLANTVTTNSPSKSFNIAGLQIANIITADKQLRDKIDRALNIHEVCDVNPFGVSALMAAYNESEAWLDALREYIHQNYLVVVEFINQHLPRLSVIQQEATYLAWIDCRQLDLPSAEIGEKLITEGALMLNQGAVYGTQGEGYIRLNMACPRAQLLDGLQRMARVLGNL